MSTCRKILISSLLLLFAVSAFSVQIVPMIVFQNGIDTDSIIVQDLFSVADFNFGIGFNLKRVGFDIGYVTPYLMRSIIIHFGVFHRWEDFNTQFRPAFGIGASIKF